MVRAVELRTASIYQPGSLPVCSIADRVALTYRRSIRIQESEVTLLLHPESEAARVIGQQQVLRIIRENDHEEWVVDDLDENDRGDRIAICRSLIYKLAEPPAVRTIVSATGLPSFRFALTNVLPASILQTYVRQPMLDEGHQWLQIGTLDFLTPLDEFSFDRQKPLGVLEALAGHPQIDGEYTLRDTGSAWELELVRTLNGTMPPVPVRFRKNLESIGRQRRGVDLYTAIEPVADQAPDGTPGTMGYNGWEVVDLQLSTLALWPADLPPAARQTPHWGVHDVVMVGTPVNDAAPVPAIDPVTGARAIRLTGTTTHGGGNGGNEYGAGGAKVSLPWGAASEMVSLSYVQGGGSRLLDLNTVTGVITRRYTNPGANAVLAFSFSRNPATPQDLFWVNQGAAVIKRRNTVTGTDTTVATLTALAPSTSHQWFDVSADERDFVFQNDNASTGYVIHWDAQLAVGTKKTIANLQAVIPGVTINEVHLVKEGGYAIISCNPAPNIILWNLRTHVLSNVTAHATAWTHGDSVGGYHIIQPANGRTFDPSVPTATNRYSLTETTENGAFHISAQWRQTVPLGDRYWGISHSDNGRIQNWNNCTWTVHSGAIYKTTPAYFGGTGQSSARMASGGMLRQYVTGDRTRYRARLTQVGSLGALVAPGQWFHDDTGVSGPANTLYVWALDSLNLSDVATPLNNMVGVTCPSAACDCLALVQVSTVKDVRLFAHHYSHFDPTINPDAYYPQPRAALFQDGKGFIGTTNMGVAGGRLDLWAWLPPLAGGGGGGGGIAKIQLADPLGGPPPIGYDTQLNGKHVFRHLKGSSQAIVNSFAATQEVELPNAAHYAIGDIVEIRDGAPTFDAIDYQQTFGATQYPTRITAVNTGARQVTLDQPFASAADAITKNDGYLGWNARILSRILTTTTVSFTLSTMKLRVVAAVTTVQVGDIVYLTSNAVTGAPPWFAHTTHFSARVEAIDTVNKDLTVSVRPQYGGYAANLSGAVQCSIWRPDAVTEIDTCAATGNTANLLDVSAAAVDDLLEIFRAVDGRLTTELTAPSQVAIYGRRVGPLEVGGPAHNQVAPNAFYASWPGGANALPEGYEPTLSTVPVGGLRVSGAGNVVHGVFSAKMRRAAVTLTVLSTAGQPFLNVASTGDMVVGSVLRVNDGQPTAETVTVLVIVSPTQIQCAANLTNVHGNNENVWEFGASGVQGSQSGVTSMSTPLHVMPVPAPNTTVSFQAHVKAHALLSAQQAELRVIGLGGAVLGVAQTSQVDTFRSIGCQVQMNPGQQFRVELRLSNPSLLNNANIQQSLIVDAVNWTFTTYTPELFAEYPLGTRPWQAANDRLPATAFLPGVWQIQVADLSWAFPDEAFVEGASVELTHPDFGALGVTRRIRAVAGDYSNATPTTLELETDEQAMTRLMAEARVETPRVVVTLTPGSTGPVPGVTATVTSVLQRQPVRFGGINVPSAAPIAPKLV